MKKRTVVFILAVATLGGNGDAAVTGQWDFDHGDLRPTIGKALDYLDGASGATAGATAFNTTTGFGIPNIGGTVARVMRFPKMSSDSMGYAVAHGAQPNGGGTNVNEYTVIMDILYPSASSGVFRSLFQTDNIGSGDFFVNRGNGIGISGDYAGNLTPDVWHRVAFAVNAGLVVPVVSEFVDGIKVAQQKLDLGPDGRWSLRPSLYLFNDAGGESRMGYLNSLQIRDRKLSDAELRLLGGPGARGIPTNDLPEHPFVESFTPADNAWLVPQDTSIRAIINDGQRSLRTNTIQLLLNARRVLPKISREGRTTTVIYEPAPPLTTPTNRVVLVFNDGFKTVTNAWRFITRAHEQKHSITGQWDFDRTNLAARIGRPLEYLDGPAGASRNAIQFGTTTAFGIPDINGVAARVIRFAGASARDIGLIMPHGATPNGETGATRVNHWTLIVDIMVPNAKNEKWLALLQTDPLNTSDADLLARFANGRGGPGTTGQYEGKGAMIAGQWHRLAFAVDANFSMLNKYIDGQLFAVQGLPGAELDGRHSLGPTSLLFADEDGESQPAYINSIQFRNYTMEEEEIAALGGPDASGIPSASRQ